MENCYAAINGSCSWLGLVIYAAVSLANHVGTLADFGFARHQPSMVELRRDSPLEEYPMDSFHSFEFASNGPHRSRFEFVGFHPRRLSDYSKPIPKEQTSVSARNSLRLLQFG